MDWRTEYCGYPAWAWVFILCALLFGLCTVLGKQRSPRKSPTADMQIRPKEDPSPHIEASPTLTLSDFDALPPLPKHPPLEGADTFTPLITIAGAPTEAVSRQQTEVKAGDHSCLVPAGARLKLIARRGDNLFITLLDPPCESGSGFIAQGYIERKDVKFPTRYFQ